MEFLYGEMPRARRTELEQHLRECEPCAREKAEYEQTMAQLGKWKVERAAPAPTASEWPRVAKWAAAAALFVSTGFATGRLATPQIKPEEIQAQVVKPLEERMTRELSAKFEREVQLAAERELRMLQERVQALAEKAAADIALSEQRFAAAVATLRERDTALYSSLEQIEAKRQADSRAMREDLEKVALFTDRSVRNAQRQLVQLTSLTQNAQ